MAGLQDAASQPALRFNFPGGGAGEGAATFLFGGVSESRVVQGARRCG